MAPEGLEANKAADFEEELGFVANVAFGSKMALNNSNLPKSIHNCCFEARWKNFGLAFDFACYFVRFDSACYNDPYSDDFLRQYLQARFVDNFLGRVNEVVTKESEYRKIQP
jgi:hypothetical protein